MCDFFIFSGVMLSLALAIGLPVYGVVLFQRWQRNRAESVRIGKIKEGKKHPHFTLDRENRSKAKLKHIEANTMSLGLRKLVRTGSSYDKGIMG